MCFFTFANNNLSRKIICSRVHFRRALTHFETKKLEEYVAFLSKVPEFGALTAYERTKICDALEEVSFQPGQVQCVGSDDSLKT